MTIKLYISGLYIGLLTVTIAPPAVAQEADARDEVDREVTVEMDEQARATVDGEEVATDEREVVVRVRRGDSLRVERPGRHVIRVPERRVERFVHRGDGVDAATFFRRPGRSHPAPHLPPVDLMFDDMKFEFDFPGRIGARVEEHLEIAELERESRRLAAEARRAEDTERQDLEARLRAKLDEIFDKKLEIRREHVQRLRDEVQEQQEDLEERVDARGDLIQRRFDELLGRSDELEW